MKIITYIIALALIAFTIFNLLATSTAKKRQKSSKQSYQAAIWPIEKRLLSVMKSRGSDYTVVKRMVSDLGNGIIFAYDPKKGECVIGMADDTLIFNSSDIVNAKTNYLQKGKKVLKADVILTLSDAEYTYEIAAKPFNPKGLIGKVLYDTTEEFCAALNEAKVGNNG